MTGPAYSKPQSRTGVFVAIVGPSGVGKDTVLSHLQTLIGKCPGFVFPKRIVTRQSDASEDSIEIGKADFDAQNSSGAFALAWSAHGLDYAVPIFVQDEILAGKMVVVNVSRAVIGQMRACFQHTCIVLVSAPLETRAQRIALRGREDESDIHARLARTVSSFCEHEADLIVDNSGSPEDAARALLDYLLSIKARLQV